MYHLNSFVKYEDKYEVPYHLTQDGISQSCGISRAHAAIELKKLKSADLVEERLSHVRRGKTRRKVYLLTHEGKSKAAAIHLYVRENGIDPSVDQSKVPADASVAGGRPAIRSTPMPAIRHFVGREGELAELGGAIQDPSRKLVVIKGIPGIGKTTLAVKLLSSLSEYRVFWHTVRPWDTPRVLADTVASFLSENGNRRLSSYLASGGFELGEISFLLREMLTENGHIFVFDDADASPSLNGFLQMFRHSSGAGKILMTLQGEADLYERSEVVASREVFEYELGGLSRDAALELLASRGIGDEVGQEIFDATNGHPLSLEMVTKCTINEAKSQLSMFFEEKFFCGLSEDQRSLLQFASVFQKPFPTDAIPRGLKGVRKGSMLRESEPGKFEIHASIRDFVYHQMSAEDRARWHSVAADHYLRAADPNERLMHLFKANRVLEAEMLISRLGESVLDGGNALRLWQALERHDPVKAKYRLQVQLVKGRLASALGRYDDAWPLLEEAAGNGDDEIRAESLIEMGDIRARQGAYGEASRLFGEALAGSEEALSTRARALRGLGLVESKTGDLGKARELLERSAQDSLSVMDKTGMLKAHLELGAVLMAQGDYEGAIEHFSKCAAGFQAVDLAKAYLDLGAACSHLGRNEEAKQHLENSINVCERNGQLKTSASARMSLSEVMMALGDPAAARECCYEALEILTELGDLDGASSVYASLSKVEGSAGNVEASGECMAESARIAEIAKGAPQQNDSQETARSTGARPCTVEEAHPGEPGSDRGHT